MDPDDIQTNEPESRRDAILAGFEAAENGEQSEARARDEAGRFAPKQEPAPAAEAVAAVQQAPAEAVPVAAPPSLTTWKKEFMPLQQKLADGIPLTPEEARSLADYNIQREKQYSTGVSTYKAEAEQARQLNEAMSEFLPTLQQHGLQPVQWIQNLGRAHHTLAMGSPEQKLQMFARLAQDYGVPLAAVQQAQGGQVDPLAMQLMHQLQSLQQNVQGITSWREQQEQQVIQQEIAKFTDATQYPHFEQVRGTMAQLLESGLAQNPDEAYAKAVRLDEGIAAQEQQRQAAAQAAATAQTRQAAVAKAKGAAVSVRSATPSGGATTAPPADRRAALAAAFDSADSGRV